MKGLCAALLVTLMLAGVTGPAVADIAPVQIFYDLQDLGGRQWKYAYRVQNNSLTDSYDGVTWFTTFFPVDEGNPTSLYSNIAPVAPPPHNWDPVTYQPFETHSGEYIYGGPRGMYDALSRHGASPVYPDHSLSGFNVTFTYTGTEPPGPQYFEVVDLNLEEGGWQKIWFTGYTTPLVMPVPSSALMLASGLFGLALVRRKH